MKRPFSEGSLAELRAADAAVTPVVVAGGGATPVATNPPTSIPEARPVDPKVAEPRPTETKPGETAKPATAVGCAWPSKGRVLAGFSEPKQMGLSIEGKLGDPIAAAGDGKVIFSGLGPRGYGNLIIVKHEGELLSVYAHNKTLLVKENQEVKKGAWKAPHSMRSQIKYCRNLGVSVWHSLLFISPCSSTVRTVVY